MSMSDPIADMLTRVRNALGRGHDSVAMPHSTVKEAIAAVLQAEGYVNGFEVVEAEPQPALRIDLKYVGTRRKKRSVITGIDRVSKPGRRVYVGKNEIPWVLSGMGIAILSTSQGLLTDSDARRKKTGGELLCKVW